jgi:hypothetical protein
MSRKKGYKNKIKNASKIIKNYKEINKCSICNGKYDGYGHNADPINDGRCCSKCNSEFVILKRLEDVMKVYEKNN